MPIIFEELEKFFVDWYRLMNLKIPITDKASKYSYNIMNKKAKQDFCDKILHLFQSIDIQNIEIKEEVTPSRTHDKFLLSKNIIINKHRSSL